MFVRAESSFCPIFVIFSPNFGLKLSRLCYYTVIHVRWNFHSILTVGTCPDWKRRCRSQNVDDIKQNSSSWVLIPLVGSLFDPTESFRRALYPNQRRNQWNGRGNSLILCHYDWFSKDYNLDKFWQHLVTNSEAVPNENDKAISSEIR